MLNICWVVLRKWWWMRVARSALNKIHEIHDGYSCGKDVVEHVAGHRLAPLKKEFNAALDKLAEIDPLTPATRF